MVLGIYRHVHQICKYIVTSIHVEEGKPDRTVMTNFPVKKPLIKLNLCKPIPR